MKRFSPRPVGRVAATNNGPSDLNPTPSVNRTGFLAMTIAQPQPSLFDDIVLAPLAAPEWLERNFPRRETIDERFTEFHRANPIVYEALRALCLDTRRVGVKRWSVDAAMHIVRWRYRLQTKGSEFKIDNSFSALYARMLMKREPELAGFFELRKRRNGHNGDGDDV